MQSKNAPHRAFVRDESGASAAEYSLILGVIGFGVIAAAAYLGGAIAAQITDAAACIQSRGAACN